MWEYKARVTRVVDGDTLDLRIDLGFSISVEIRARLSGVDTPETYGVKKGCAEYLAGKRATEFVEAWLESPEVVVRSRKNSTGKYGRWIVEVFNEREESLNEALLQSGLAKPYR
jgi:micrococcal nuclease